MGGEVDDVAQRQKSWWSNRLVLPGIDLREHAEIRHERKDRESSDDIVAEETPARRRRLANAYLPKADFTGAELRGRSLRSGAAARRAASTWRSCRARGSTGRSCRARRSTGRSCRARRSMRRSFRARRSTWARLQGASLVGAQLQGALLDRAQLQGASLDGAQLQGAWLDRAQLQGASLDGAQLQGASLDRAQLQGASLDRAQLAGRVACRNLCLASRRPTIDATDAYVERPETGRKYRGLDCDRRASLATGRARPTPRCGGSSRTEFPRGTCERRRWPASPVLDPEKQENRLPRSGLELEKNRPALAEYQKSSPKCSREIGCKAEGAPYVVRGLLPRLDGAWTPPRRAGGGCLSERRSLPGRARPVGRGQSGSLREISDRAPPRGRTGAAGQRAE